MSLEPTDFESSWLWLGHVPCSRGAFKGRFPTATNKPLPSPTLSYHEPFCNAGTPKAWLHRPTWSLDPRPSQRCRDISCASSARTCSLRISQSAPAPQTAEDQGSPRAIRSVLLSLCKRLQSTSSTGMPGIDARVDKLEQLLAFRGTLKVEWRTCLGCCRHAFDFNFSPAGRCQDSDRATKPPAGILV